MGPINISTPINVYVTCGCCEKKHRWCDDSVVVTDVQPEGCNIPIQPEDDSIEQ